MSKVVDVECPYCSEETTALVPRGSTVVRTAQDMIQGLPNYVDTAVRTTCAECQEFVVFLQE